jgi:hypothetical protein
MNDWELFEIKRVVPLSRTHRDIPVVTSEVTNAIQQLKNYNRILNQDVVKRDFAKQGIHYYEPSLNLVIGKEPSIPHATWRYLATSDNDVRILTYDNLLSQMENRLNIFEKLLK